MARPSPSLNAITSNLENWDAEVDDNFDQLVDLCFTNPFPAARYATTGALPAASSYENCLAFVEVDDLIYISDGTNWNPIGTQCANQADSTATIVADIVSDFNDLLAKLQASGLMA